MFRALLDVHSLDSFGLSSYSAEPSLVSTKATSFKGGGPMQGGKDSDWPGSADEPRGSSKRGKPQPRPSKDFYASMGTTLTPQGTSTQMPIDLRTDTTLTSAKQANQRERFFLKTRTAFAAGLLAWAGGLHIFGKKVLEKGWDFGQATAKSLGKLQQMTRKLKKGDTKKSKKKKKSSVKSDSSLKSNSS